MWLVGRNEDKRNPSTADRSHQLALTHLRQHTTSSMYLLQHPIIKSATFGEHSWPTISLTTGWLLGNITRFSNEEYTLSSGWGHYPTMLKVIFLFVSACRNTEENFADHPRYLPWDSQGGGGWDGCSPPLVERHLPELVLWWLVVGPHDLQGWMALCGQLDEDQRSVIVVVTAYRGPGLEGSQQLSSPSYASDQAWYCHCALVPSQDNEAWICHRYDFWYVLRKGLNFFRTF